MRYVSTRSYKENITFEEVLVSGLARDGGLYVPKTWPRFNTDDMCGLAGLSYQEIAFKIMKPFTGEAFSDLELKSMIEKAYSSFDHKAICPIVQLSKNQFLLELFHGPTLAFKDFAMQIIGQMFEHVLRKKNLRASVVAATSGDTGSAAMAAFKKSDLVDVFVLFPNGRVSDVQRKQMTTLNQSNIHALAIDGDFDDCQSLVKQMFNDSYFRDSVNLTGVNSINWARVMAQVVYFFVAAIGLGAPARSVNFSVPTGNFGDIFAAYVAKKMGLTINKLIIASNQNDILHRTMKTGVYSKQVLTQTISPSMDIQVASNFERLLFDLYGGQVELVNQAMNGLMKDNKFEVGKDALCKFRRHFLSGSASEKITEQTIKSALDDYKELVCPHTAVGLAVARTQEEECGSIPLVTLATAHPAKFPGSVAKCTGITPKLPDRYANLFSKNEVYTSVKNNLDDVKKIIAERTSVCQ